MPGNAGGVSTTGPGIIILNGGNMERLYIITYRLYEPNGGSFRYAANPSYVDQVLYYNKSERGEFIAKYNHLKEKEQNDIYIDNIKCMYVDTFNDITDKMDDIINAI